MPITVLATKLYVPQPRHDVICRAWLTRRLNDGLHRKLTLLSAPAGFGKTTLLCEWLAACGRPSAWLSLDEGESDPARFVTYVVAALQRISPEIGTESLSAMESSQAPAVESVLMPLINELASLQNNLVLVLDDYHTVDARWVDNAVSFLVEHLPPQMHLVVASREDPQLPLARLRARNDLTELRAADMRFTAAEAAEFLNQVMGLRLSVADVAALEERTEGWIAGLQLAALSMQDREDVSEFIRAFTGNHRHVVDYLMAEVLQTLPDAEREFLLQTAILDRLSGALCDAVTSGTDSGARLEALERGNFFVVPLDDRREWYRYHHLFAEVLQAHLNAEQPGRLPVLHGRASNWYEDHGSPADAIRHALAGEDFDRAARLIEATVPEMRRTRQEVTLMGWLRALPEELFASRPVLSNDFAGALLTSGVLEGVDARLQDAERWLLSAEDRAGTPECRLDGMVAVDQAELRRLPGAVAIHRAGLALAQGDVATTVRHASRARDLLPDDDNLGIGSASALLGLASWANGDLEAAHRGYAAAKARLQLAGHYADALGCTIALADLRIAQGHLHEAMRTCERELRLASEQGLPALRGTADMHVSLAELYLEHADDQKAMLHLQASKELGVGAGLPQNPYRWCVAMARVREATGDFDGACELLDEAERLYVGDFFPNIRPVAACKARVWLAQRRLREVFDWAHERNISAGDRLTYRREFEHLTLARALLARYQEDGTERAFQELAELLHRLLGAADEGARLGSVIDILALQAVAQQLKGDFKAALPPLQRALALAEPEGYCRTFVEHGPPMAALLKQASKQGGAPGYVRQLQAVLRGDRSPASSARELVEPLSDRERHVLRLLTSELSGPEIAGELVVSLNTLRTHTKSIYGKLGVNSRRAAIRRAQELDLA